MNRPSEAGSEPLSALVLAQLEIAFLANDVLRSHGFEIKQAGDAPSAGELCRHRRFDLGVYDDSVHGAMELAGSGHSASLPRVSIGLLKNGIRVFPRLHFVLPKPLRTEVFSKTVRAALAPIAADRRQSFRHCAHIDVESCSLLQGGLARKLSGVKIVNLSLTGLCLEAAEMLPQSAMIELEFALGSSGTKVCLTGTVVWSHTSGRAGIKLRHVRRDDQLRLEDWVDAMFRAETSPSLR